MVSPSFSNGLFVRSIRTWLPVAALASRWVDAGSTEERIEGSVGPGEAQISKITFGALDGTFGALDGAFGALNGAFGAFGALDGAFGALVL